MESDRPVFTRRTAELVFPMFPFHIHKWIKAIIRRISPGFVLVSLFLRKRRGKQEIRV